jgi:hypothetical protein
MAAMVSDVGVGVPSAGGATGSAMWGRLSAQSGQGAHADTATGATLGHAVWAGSAGRASGGALVIAACGAGGAASGGAASGGPRPCPLPRPIQPMVVTIPQMAPAIAT